MTNQAGISEKTFVWPYKVDYDKVNHIEVDVLVVGGGLAGAAAGISAARKGLKVAVADKAPIKRSGNGGAGMDHWNNLLSNPDSPMSPEENAVKGNTDGRQGHRDYIAVKGTWNALMELKKLGMPLADDEFEFEGTATRDEKTGMLKAYDYRNFIACKLRGGQYIKPLLYKGLLEAGAQLFERVMITSLLTEGGKQGAKAVGATGFSMETGEFYVFHAKSVILASGYAKNLFTVRSKKSDYVISKSIVCFVAGASMIVAFFIGSMIGGAIAGLPFALEGATALNVIMCMLSKILLVGIFSSIYVLASVFAKQKLWLSLIMAFAIGMLMFMMIPIITPLNSSIVNVILCLVGSALFSVGIGFGSKAILEKSSLV